MVDKLVLLDGVLSFWRTVHVMTLLEYAGDFPIHTNEMIPNLILHNVRVRVPERD